MERTYLERLSLHSKTTQRYPLLFDRGDHSLSKILLLNQNGFCTDDVIKKITNRNSAHIKDTSNQNQLGIRLKQYIGKRSLLKINEEKSKRRQQIKKKIKIKLNQQNLVKENSKDSIMITNMQKNCQTNTSFQVLNPKQHKNVYKLLKKSIYQKCIPAECRKIITNFKSIYKDKYYNVFEDVSNMSTNQFSVYKQRNHKDKQVLQNRQRKSNKKQLNTKSKATYLKFNYLKGFKRNKNCISDQQQQIKPWNAQIHEGQEENRLEMR